VSSSRVEPARAPTFTRHRSLLYVRRAQGCAHAGGGHPGHSPPREAGRGGADQAGVRGQQGVGGEAWCSWV